MISNNDVSLINVDGISTKNRLRTGYCCLLSPNILNLQLTAIGINWNGYNELNVLKLDATSVCMHIHLRGHVYLICVCVMRSKRLMQKLYVIVGLLVTACIFLTFYM